MTENRLDKLRKLVEKEKVVRDRIKKNTKLGVRNVKNEGNKKEGDV